MRTTSRSMVSVLAGVVVALALGLSAPGAEAAPKQSVAPLVRAVPELPDPDLPGQGGFKLPSLPPIPTIPQLPTAPNPTIPTWTPPVATIPTPPTWTDTETTDPPGATETSPSTDDTDNSGSQHGASTLPPGPTGAPAGATATATAKPPDPRLTLTPDQGPSSTVRGPSSTTGRPIPTTDESGTPGPAGSPPVDLIALAGLTSLAAAAGAGVMVRARQVRRWATEHVHTQARPAPAVVAVEPPPGQMHGHSVHLEPREDAGHQFIEENDRDQN